MTSRRSSKRDDATAFDPQEYAEFINQIELLGIWLDSAEIDNVRGPIMPDRVDISIMSSGEWKTIDTGFIAVHRHDVTLAVGDESAAEFVVSFGLEFSSSMPMTDDLFEVFEDVNLPINTWPYLREFLGSSLGRMGWVAFTLPSLKVGTKSTSEPPAKAARRRRASTTKPPTTGR
jgi:hypothetical protein